jgi:hypothetical protein
MWRLPFKDETWELVDLFMALVIRKLQARQPLMFLLD